MLPEFIMMETFDKNWNKLKLTDDELQIVQEQICNNPNVGDVIPGTEGLRKLRVAFPNRGKRGSGRVCYVNFLLSGVVYLISIYAKNEQSTLSQAEIHNINNLIIDLKQKHEGDNKMSVSEDIIKGLQQAVEYANGNHSVGRKVRYVPKNIKLTIKEDECLTESQSSKKYTGRTWKELINDIESNSDWIVDSVDRNSFGGPRGQRSNTILLYNRNKDGVFVGEVTKYSDGSYELMDYNITETNDWNE